MSDQRYCVWLNEYQIANLRAVIEAIGYPWAAVEGDAGPLGALNTGDWLGEVYNQLPDVEYEPNESAAAMRQAAVVKTRLYVERVVEP